MRSPMRPVALALLLAALLFGADAARIASTASLERSSVVSVVEQAKASLGPVKNAKPLIGIMTQPCADCPGKSYIAAGFVKWIEAAGGRAVPIRFYASDKELYRIFKSINGIVFPGGLTWLWLDAPYVITARKLFNWAVEANDNGEPFPIHGTCLGFQLLHILASNVSRNDLLVDTDSVAQPTTLQFYKDSETTSRMFGDLPPSLKHALTSDAYNIVLQNHMYGMPPPMYEKYPVLSEWYSIVSTSVDRNGTKYVSSMEGKKYPFTGTQWHPEKPPFEFGMDEVPHSIEAIRVSQHVANVFIETARRSPHSPESPESELALEIYDTCPTFSIRFEVTDEENYDGPDMTYYFDKHEDPPVGPDDDGKGVSKLAAVDTGSTPKGNEGKAARGTSSALLRSAHPEGFFLG